MNKLSHLDARGRARMVDVGGKAVTVREAVATGTVRMNPAVLRLLVTGQMPKGDVLAVAR
ncbi:MAG TPA: cyclic pyranopterin monophosphate synthase MoaC, partial [Candidatus Binatia bacterium]|nr:cyclic pyranopterin monophosphate synthase MoaC [Candidatus Binatia bacterium]